MPSVLIAKEDGVALLDFDLRPGKTYVLGRSAAADVRLEAQSISRLHAILFRHDGGWRISDLGSRKGLRTEAGTVRDYQLVHGGWVAVGPAVIWFFDERAEANELQESTSESLDGDAEPEQEPRKLQVLMIQRPDTEEPYAVALVRKSISIGSSNTCDITMNVRGLEPMHLVVFRIRGIWHAAAIENANLMDSDGVASRCAILQTTTALQAGPLSLSLMDTHLPRPTEQAPSEADSAVAELTGDDDPLDIDLKELDRNGNNPGGRPSAPDH